MGKKAFYFLAYPIHVGSRSRHSDKRIEIQQTQKRNNSFNLSCLSCKLDYFTGIVHQIIPLYFSCLDQEVFSVDCVS